MMTCTCIADHVKALKKEFGPDTELINPRRVTNLKTGKTWPELQPLRFRYRKLKKDGTPSKTWVKTFVNNNFCGLCGKAKTK